MKKLLLLSVAAVAISASSLSVRAADMDPGCYLAASAKVGGIYDWANGQVDLGGVGGPNIDGDTDWKSLFGEGGGLVSCNNFNFQADFAQYSHSTDIDLGIAGKDLSGDTYHYGGALFWRDQSVGMIGITGSRISNELLSKDIDYTRIGLAGEYYLNDQLTVGARVNYVFADQFLDAVDHDGFELQANMKYYATPDLSLNIDGAYLNSTVSIDTGGPNFDVDVNGWSAGAEAEYQVMHQGLSLFAGGRYTLRTADTSSLIGDDIDLSDAQIYAGVRFALGGNNSSLAERDRSNIIDNTSVFLEKVPNLGASAIAGAINGGL